jgi:hypothetical protein
MELQLNQNMGILLKAAALEAAKKMTSFTIKSRVTGSTP